MAKSDWKDVGTVADEATGLAARVYLRTGLRFPVPVIQLGRLTGPYRVFHPSLLPEVSWKDGKGAITELPRFGEVPDSLKHAIAKLLEPHLSEVSAVGELKDFDLAELPEVGAIGHALGCLSCS